MAYQSYQRFWVWKRTSRKVGVSALWYFVGYSEIHVLQSKLLNELEAHGAALSEGAWGERAGVALPVEADGVAAAVGRVVRGGAQLLVAAREVRRLPEVAVVLEELAHHLAAPRLARHHQETLDRLPRPAAGVDLHCTRYHTNNVCTLCPLFFEIFRWKRYDGIFLKFMRHLPHALNW